MEESESMIANLMLLLIQFGLFLQKHTSVEEETAIQPPERGRLS